MYTANLVGGLPQLLLPLVALSRVGAQQAAYWSIATSISAILFSLPSMVATALLPEVSFRPAERRQLLRRAALLTVAIVAPALVVAFFGVPIVLAAFGNGYTSGTLTPVRWLIGAGFITILNAVSGAILFIAKKSTVITVVNAVNAVIVLGMVALWATSATGHRHRLGCRRRGQHAALRWLRLPGGSRGGRALGETRRSAGRRHRRGARGTSADSQQSTSSSSR